jgi:hypothetical protein
MDTVSISAPEVLQRYYRVLTAGADAFGDGRSLRVLLSDHLDFTGSLAGHRPDSTEGFLRGAAGFISTVRSIEVLREVHDETGSAILYDAEMPGLHRQRRSLTGAHDVAGRTGRSF